MCDTFAVAESTRTFGFSEPVANLGSHKHDLLLGLFRDDALDGFAADFFAGFCCDLVDDVFFAVYPRSLDLFGTNWPVGIEDGAYRKSHVFFDSCRLYTL